MSGRSGFSNEASWDTDRRKTIKKYSLAKAEQWGDIQNSRNGTSTFVDIYVLSHR